MPHGFNWASLMMTWLGDILSTTWGQLGDDLGTTLAKLGNTLPKLSKGVCKSCHVLPKKCPSHPQVVPRKCQRCPKSSSVMSSRTYKVSMKPADQVHCLWYSYCGSKSESPVSRTGVIWKSGWLGWVTIRSGWLLELLTELIKMIKDKERRNCPPWRVARSINLKKIKRKRIAHLDTCQVNEDDIIKERKELH